MRISDAKTVALVCVLSLLCFVRVAWTPFGTTMDGSSNGHTQATPDAAGVRNATYHSVPIRTVSERPGSTERMSETTARAPLLLSVSEQLRRETEAFEFARASFLPRPWLNRGWCWGNETATKNTPAGLVYWKTQKAASSTLSGITLRIANRYGTQGTRCRTLHKHSAVRYPGRDRSRSFFFASIRDPASRTLSWLQYAANNRGLDDHWVWEKLQARYIINFREKVRWDNGYQLGYLSATKPNEERPMVYPRDETKIRRRVRKVLEELDFIMLYERLDESMVVLKFLLNLTTSDILYTKGSKERGAYSAVGGKCHLLRPYNRTQYDDYFATSNDWMKHNWGDYLLYHMANASLDATIEALGKQKFDAALAEYRHSLEKAQSLCAANTTFPCSPNGDYVGSEDCYAMDWGCGYRCLDQNFQTN